MLGYIYSQLRVVGIALCITAFGVLLPSLLAILSLICLVENTKLDQRSGQDFWWP